MMKVRYASSSISFLRTEAIIFADSISMPENQYVSPASKRY